MKKPFLDLDLLYSRTTMRVWWVLLGLAVVGCVKHNSRECNDGICSDAEFPFCDDDGSVAGTPSTCIAVSCTPGTFEECRGDELITCSADGMNYDVMMCATGCDEAAMACNACTPNTVTCSDDKTLATCGTDGTVTSQVCDIACVDGEHPHCAYLEPKYLPDVCDAPAVAPQLDLTGTGTFDTGLDTNCNGGIVAQASAPEICVVRYGEISIASDAIVSATGPRVLALISDDALSIAGVLDGGVKGTVGGPGGGFILGATLRGDGAGSRTNGGTGGGAGGTGGPAQPNPSTQAVIYGGTRAAGNTTNGGGAVILTACRGTVSIPGTVTVGGGGGLGDNSPMGKTFGGFGGGSGGNVVIQALAITITGQVFSNGGGGGGGRIGQNFGNPGGDALASDTIAAPGGTAVAPATSGGTGAVSGQNSGFPGNGGTPQTGGSGGGGGGSQGFLQAYAPAGVVPNLTPSHVSPPFEPNGTISTR